MHNPNIKTKVVHSRSTAAWNVLGTKLGAKFKIAVVPYPVSTDADVLGAMSDEAKNHAEFISFCFNNSEEILNRIEPISVIPGSK